MPRGEHTKPAIADRSLVVFDPAMGIDRQIRAGKEVPFGLEEAYARATRSAQKPASEGKPAASEKKPQGS